MWETYDELRGLDAPEGAGTNSVIVTNNPSDAEVVVIKVEWGARVVVDDTSGVDEGPEIVDVTEADVVESTKAVDPSEFEVEFVVPLLDEGLSTALDELDFDVQTSATPQ